jgi:hypothetical protein
LDFTSFCSEEILYFGVVATVLPTLKLPFAASQTTKDVRVVGFVEPLAGRLHVQYYTITIGTLCVWMFTDRKVHWNY